MCVAVLLCAAMSRAQAALIPSSGWQIYRDDDGRARVLCGGATDPLSGSMEQAATAFLSRFSDELGLRADLSDLEVAGTASERQGSRVRFRQKVGTLPLWGSGVTVVLTPDGRGCWAESTYKPGLQSSPAGLLSADEAAASVAQDPVLRGQPELLASPAQVAWAVGDRAIPAWYLTLRRDGAIPWGYVVDARAGRVLLRKRLATSALPVAYCYPANPIRSPVRQSVELPDLDSTTRLSSSYAEVVFKGAMGLRGLTGQRVKPSSDGSYLFAPGTDGFTQANTYHQLARVFGYFSKLGFTGGKGRLAVLLRHRDEASTPFLDAVYSDTGFGSEGAILMGEGEGGEDLALDADILLHEFTHYVTYRVAGLNSLKGSPEGEGLGEGYSDYFSSTMEGDPRVSEFGGRVLGLGKSIRDLTNRNHYPEDLPIPVPELRSVSLNPWAEAHQLGEVWGGALWDLRKALGAGVTDQLVYDSFLRLSDSSDFRIALLALLETDAQSHGGSHSAKIRQVFAARGITPEMVPGYLSESAFGDQIVISPISVMGTPSVLDYTFITPVPIVGSYVAGSSYLLEGAVFDSTALDTVKVYLADAKGSPLQGVSTTDSVAKNDVEDYLMGAGKTFGATLRLPASLEPGVYYLGIAALAKGKTVVDSQARVRVIKDGGPAEVLDPEPAPTKFPILGDADGDGQLGAEDVRLGLRQMAGLVPAQEPVLASLDFLPHNADGSLGDGKLSVGEVVWILRAALGQVAAPTGDPNGASSPVPPNRVP